MADTTDERSASEHIDARIAELGDWRGEVLAAAREVIHEAVPGVTEAWKWRGVPVWESNGIICTGESYKDKIKLTFAKGAALDDPTGVFNASLDGNTRRAVDYFALDELDRDALGALVRRAAELNAAKRTK